MVRFDEPTKLALHQGFKPEVIRQASGKALMHVSNLA
jgi:hypothetical protein